MIDTNHSSLHNSSEYFASREPDALAGILLDKAKTFYNVMESNAYLDKLNKMYKAYHGAYMNDVSGGHEITFTGEQGELVSLPVNHFRNIARHIFIMVTANRPILESRAINTDYKSLAQTYLANGILDYYMREKHLEDCLKKAVEYAIVLGAGFIKLDWNATAGDQYEVDEETGEKIFEGDLQFSNLSPLDVVVDGTKESWDNDWIIVRSFKNRFDLIAKYPEHKDKLLGIPSKQDASIMKLAVWSNDKTDDIAVYEFYHKRTESMPEGRYMFFADVNCVMLDSPLPYRVVPIFRISPSDILGTPYGYSPMFDIFPIQEAVNSMYSAIMTNNNAFAVQSLFVQRDSDISINSLGEGMNIIEGNSPPIPLQLTQTPKESFEFLKLLIQSAETISGVSSVSRGNPEASLRSGSALALVQSMSLQFMSELQQSYVKLMEDVGSSLIQILKDFATTPRIIALVGKNNRPLLKEFTGEQISSINRVYVDVGNPLSRSIAGRVQMAEQMLQMKVLKSPEQYFQVLNTGRLDSAFEGDMMELLLIKSENEALMNGENPIVSPLDQHSLHIREHKSVLADPDLRKDQTLVKACLDHIEEHLNMLRTTDPALLQLCGEQAIPPIAPPGDPNQPPQGGPPPGVGGPPQQGGGNPAMPNGQHPMEPKAPHPSSSKKVMQQSPQGNEIHGGSVSNPNGEHLPNVPKPPAPFKNLPVSPQDVGHQ